jgi:hypothetical protein
MLHMKYEGLTPLLHYIRAQFYQGAASGWLPQIRLMIALEAYSN